MTVAVDVSFVDGVVVTDVVDLSVEPLSPHAARPNTASTTAPTHTVSRPGDNRFGLVGMVQYLSSGSVVVADTRCPGSSNTASGHRGHHAKPGAPARVRHCGSRVAERAVRRRAVGGGRYLPRADKDWTQISVRRTIRPVLVVHTLSKTQCSKEFQVPTPLNMRQRFVRARRFMAITPDSPGTTSLRSTAAVALSVAAIVAAATPACASPTHRMFLLPNMHTCDFQLVTTPLGRAGAKSFAEIDSDGRSVVAHIEMTNGADSAQYVVRMIPAPHAQLGCLAGDRGITTGALATDEFGNGSLTLQAAMSPGTTGVWLAVDLPAAHSQVPREFYSSNYIAAV